MNDFKKHLIVENDRLKQEILILQGKINELHEKMGYREGYADGYLERDNDDFEVDLEENDGM